MSQSEPDPAERQTLFDLFQSGRFSEMERAARAQTERFPQSGFAWKALGVALQAQGKENLGALQRAAELSPDDAEAAANLALALTELGRHATAESIYRNALALAPDFAVAHFGLGNVLAALGRHEEAAAAYGQVVALTPQDAAAHFNLGNSLKQLYRYDEAIASYQTALSRDPRSAAAHSNLGIVLQEVRELEAAEAHFRHALALRTDFAEAHNNLGMALTALGRFDEALVYFRQALNLQPDFVGAHSNLLLCHAYMADRDAADDLAEARDFGALVARQARPFDRWENARDADRTLRIGFVSGDLCEHPVGYFLESVLAALVTGPGGNLHFTAYRTRRRDDALSLRLRQHFHRWCEVDDVSDVELAARIRSDGIDILIDLAGHTAHNRLGVFAWQPAPVQASWLGYFATTGVGAIDYVIADPWCAPPAVAEDFSETLWRLPETRLCFTPPTAMIEPGPLPALANGYLTFACFSNLAKVNDRVIALWARILDKVDGARLCLKSRQLQDAVARARLTERFTAQGVAGERLLLEVPEPRAAYLAAYCHVDITLDPFPYPGGTTSAESLWMGVPVLTLAGKRFLSRQGVGLLTNAGLADWVAADEDDYVARAIAHASDLATLAELRRGLRAQVLASPLFDAARFAGHFEAALRGMWRDWCGQH